MNKNKGFTIVELLAVITILAFLFAFVVPSVSRLFSNTKDEQYELMVTTINNAANNYIDDNMELFYGSDTDNNLIKKIRNNNVCVITSVTLETLISKNYLKENVINPKTGTNFNTDLKIDIYNDNGSKMFKFDSDNTEYTPCYYNKDTTDNYVWYSGFLWKILGVTKENTIKIVLNDNLSITNYDKNSTKYSESYVNDYLNEYFYSKLNSTNLLTDGSYCLDKRTDLNSKVTDCADNYFAKVGLLSLDEYNHINIDNTNFLNNNTNFYTLTPKDASNLYIVNENGNIGDKGVNSFIGIRPTLTLKTDTKFIKGTGSYNDPYMLNESNNIAVSKTLNTRYIGEYLNINNNIFRISEVSDNYVRIVLDSFYKKPGGVDGYYMFSSSNTNIINPNVSDNIGYILNNEIYNDLFNTETLKKITINTEYTTGTVLDNTLDVFTTSLYNYNPVIMKVSLLRIGDLLSGSNAVLTITQDASNKVYTIYDNKEIVPVSLTDVQKVHPVISIKPDVIIKSGSGTHVDPYMLEI